jgi:hypothetical protein
MTENIRIITKNGTMEDINDFLQTLGGYEIISLYERDSYEYPYGIFIKITEIVN